MLIRVKGRTAGALFDRESGGHRWQRVPPTDKHGRVHTSTITVAVMKEPASSALCLRPADLDESFTRGSGAGGQHRNKTSTAVILHHRPSGIRVRVDGGRSQHANRQAALALLRARLEGARQSAEVAARNADRKARVGSGMRGDKIRTVQVRNGRVLDHRTGKRIAYRRYARGELRALLD